MGNITEISQKGNITEISQKGNITEISQMGNITEISQMGKINFTHLWNFSMTYTIAVCTVRNSWWWAEELSETYRVLFQK